jgi:glucokinase
MAAPPAAAASSAPAPPAPATSPKLEVPTVFTPSAALLAQGPQWKGKTVYIGIDVGATNTRVGLAEDPITFTELLYTGATSVSALMSLFAQIGTWLNSLGVFPASCAIAVAGPPEADRKSVVITNWPEDNTFTIPLLPPSLCPHAKTWFVNDLEASCYGMLALNAANKLGNFFTSLWDQREVKLAPKHHLVLAMGTGLGVGLLLWVGDHFRVVPTELGHTTVTQSGPSYLAADQDSSLICFLSHKLYSSQMSAEFEDICSGRGLVWAYEWVMKHRKDAPVIDVKDKKAAGKIAIRALSEQCPYAKEALYIHYKFLFRCAQNTCVGLQTKGVLMAGDNQVANASFVQAERERFRTEFLHHPKSIHFNLVDTPVFTQTTKVNTNMIGALYIAKFPEGLK